jgi:very-short-patch-repair endonuclease
MMTPAERKLWQHLREAQFAGSHFRRQATIGRYFVDFCCHTSRLVIEVDGGSHAEDGQIIPDAHEPSFCKRAAIGCSGSGTTMSSRT